MERNSVSVAPESEDVWGALRDMSVSGRPLFVLAASGMPIPS